ncbi:hypothetical protein L226DRAFT_530235 [Lentinus tigrinus ALCF2SS1-7]|uniref:TPR-like protein n=1 Tax=Lentinus tigrinus ALCF2SS1-6 TaxID=1328759 RepID=A0A5C2SRX4_9APHY|nr:hypothetical protein L227DRAFT_570030 [Lentinus tigrinus ALCF2SS1-6]RPD80040.1 hypothetical protein L226DRAFT_530235 [Lentinus tigrinus ALCF2SS1-7]
MLSRARRRIPASLPRYTPPRPHAVLRRCLANDSKPPTPVPGGPGPAPYLNDSFAVHAMFTIDFFKRFIKYSAVGCVVLAFTTATAFEGAHLYVENVGLAPEKDEETKKWEWDLEAERWTGSPKGGTDSGLGFAGKHAVRSAWMVLNWGTGSNNSVAASKAFSGREGQGATLVPIQASLEYAQEFLRIALEIAEQANSKGKLHPMTLTALLARRADVVERMGTRNALDEARSEYERVWTNLGGKGVQAARIALKLGDLNRRLGDTEDALLWWARSMQLVQGRDNATLLTAPPSVPESLPSSPLAQRTLVSVMVSMSAFYATTGQLRQAQAVEESSLNLLRSLPSPQAFDAASPPQALHHLYVLHRSSILSIHLAEVLYALRTKSATSIEWLSRAAESSERVALSLTGLPPIHPDAPSSKIPHPPSSETPLVPAYADSQSMQGPAKALLRDSRRTAAEAWNLIGVLTEGSGSADAHTKALECYERALGWAGVGRDRAGGIGEPGEGTLESDWKVFWSNYVRARDAVRERGQK